MKRWFCFFAVVFCLTGCAFDSAPAPVEPPMPLPDPVQVADPAPVQITAPVKAQETWDIDKFASNPWLIAAFFLLVQWFEIWYYNRTGKTSVVIDTAEAAMSGKMGTVQRLLYRLWRWSYFRKHPDKQDPDKKSENEENKKC